jgi:hypothetical protein
VKISPLFSLIYCGVLQSLREEIRAESEALLGKYGGDLVPEEKPSVA